MQQTSLKVGIHPWIGYEPLFLARDNSKLASAAQSLATLMQESGQLSKRPALDPLFSASWLPQP